MKGDRTLIAIIQEAQHDLPPKQTPLPVPTPYPKTVTLDCILIFVVTTSLLFFAFLLFIKYGLKQHYLTEIQCKLPVNFKFHSSHSLKSEKQVKLISIVYFINPVYPK